MKPFRETLSELMEDIHLNMEDEARIKRVVKSWGVDYGNLLRILSGETKNVFFRTIEKVASGVHRVPVVISLDYGKRGDSMDVNCWDNEDFIYNGIPGELGRFLRMEREFQLLNQGELASWVGISRGYLNAIERGRRIPSTSVLDPLCETLLLKRAYLIPQRDIRR